jgi:hypothetical protein
LKEKGPQGWSTQTRYRNSGLHYGNGTISSRATAKRKGNAGSPAHLPQYLAEFEYRFNNLETRELFSQTLGNMLGKGAVKYQDLVSD